MELKKRRIKQSITEFIADYRKKYQLRMPNDPFYTFFYDDALSINIARLEHLESLQLSLEDRKILEVGSGVGLLTCFFENKNCEVLSTEARTDNIQENIRLHPHRKDRVLSRDLSIRGSHDDLGAFEVVFCYGTLYHLSSPHVAIQDLARCTQEILLLETCVSRDDNRKINVKVENMSNPNQAFVGAGCRPGRDWIFAELKKYFPYVYATATQPQHQNFPCRWAVSLDSKLPLCLNVKESISKLLDSVPGAYLKKLVDRISNTAEVLARSVFVASRKKICSHLLLEELPSEQNPINTQTECCNI